MTYIKRIIMQGFKSFGDREVSVDLAPGFTCIIGPNGAGKSNIIDALCFCLGRMSKKTMRAKNLSDLIFNGTVKLKPANKAVVTVIFDNSKRDFPYDMDEISVSRSIKRKGGSTFKINGKTVTREQLLNVLSQANIDPDGSNQFILQGKITEITNMNIIDRRKYIESLIGLEKYDQMKEATLKELEKADRDLGKFEAIFKEVSNQLKKYEKERNDALRWMELDKKIKDLNAKLLAIKIFKLRNEEEKLERIIEETKDNIRLIEEKISEKKHEIERTNHELSVLDSEISEKSEEKERIESEISSLKSELSSRETELKLAHENINKLSEKMRALEEAQIPPPDGKTYDDMINDVQKEIDEIAERLNQIDREIDNAESELAVMDNRISELNSAKGKMNGEISTLRQQISSLNAENKMLKGNINKYESEIEEKRSYIRSLIGNADSIESVIEHYENEIRKITDGVNDIKRKIGEINRSVDTTEYEISELENEKSGIKESVSSINAEISSLTAEVNFLMRRIEELEERRTSLEEDYNRISGGRSGEDALRELRRKEKEIVVGIEDLKKKLGNLTSEFKRRENEKAGIELNRRQIEKTLSEYSGRISAIDTELAILEKDLKKNSRELTALEFTINSLEAAISSLERELENIEKAKNSVQSRISFLEKEKDDLTEQIEKNEKEYGQTQKEIVGALRIITMFIENIDNVVGDVKGKVQSASGEAIGKYISSFRDYIFDFVDILRPIEEITQKGGDPNTLKELPKLIGTLKLFTDNVDETLNRIIENVRGASDIAVQESTRDLDRLIMDFRDFIDNITVLLRKLTISRTTKLHERVNEIVEDLRKYRIQLSELNTESSKNSVLLEGKKKELEVNKKKLESIRSEVESETEKIEKLRTERREKADKISKLRLELDKLTERESELKKEDEEYWKLQREISSALETKNAELARIRDDIRELADIRRYIDEIREITHNIESIKDEIAEKQQEIDEKEVERDELKEKIEEISATIGKLREKRSSLLTVKTELEETLSSKMDELNEARARMGEIRNIKNINREITKLESEIAESSEKIGINNSEIDKLEGRISEIMQSIEEINDEIKKIKTEKDGIRERIKQLRNMSNGLNIEIQNKKQTMNDLNEMKRREAEIENIREEITEIDIQIAEIEEEIAELEERISEKVNLRDEIIAEISELNNRHTRTWDSLKKMQENLSSLNSELSSEKASLKSAVDKQETINDKIAELYNKSKEFGALPPVDGTESEESILEEIRRTIDEKKALEPVNLKAIDYYEEVRERFDEIDMRRQTLQRERKAILDNMERIELEKTRTFMKAYHEINREFSRIFQNLSPGGSAKMILERPDKPFEGGIMIEARPRGKKVSSLDVLSGGERTLVALAFIFSIQRLAASPFYVMDEIDAALDTQNTHRVSMLIKELAKESQFLVVSHRIENIMNADLIYGVTQTDGITDIRSIDPSKYWGNTGNP